MEPQSQALKESSGVARAPILVLACLIVSIALLIPRAAIDQALGETSRLALCSLLWVATLSLPQSAGGRERWPIGLGVGLTVLGLAAQLDLARGITAPQVWATAWPTLLFMVLLQGAASRARELGQSQRHALLWFVLLPGAPMLAYTLGSTGFAELPGWFEFIASCSPLDWLAERIGGGSTAPWLPLGVAALLYSLCAGALEAVEEVGE